MAVLKRRNKMVNFRVSEDEYEYLKTLCASEGARSISDFARSAVCRSIASHASTLEEPLDRRVDRLDGKVDELGRVVRELAELVAAGQLVR
jgi:hypothetical protein